jgi:hypothetical protein
LTLLDPKLNNTKENACAQKQNKKSSAPAQRARRAHDPQRRRIRARTLHNLVIVSARH